MGKGAGSGGVGEAAGRRARHVGNVAPPSHTQAQGRVVAGAVFVCGEKVC